MAICSKRVMISARLCQILFEKSFLLCYVLLYECSKNNVPIFKSQTGQTSQTGLTCLTLPMGKLFSEHSLVNE